MDMGLLVTKEYSRETQTVDIAAKDTLIDSFGNKGLTIAHCASFLILVHQLRPLGGACAFLEPQPPLCPLS